LLGEAAVVMQWTLYFHRICGRLAEGESIPLTVIFRLQSALAPLIIANADRIVDPREKNFAIPNLAGARCRCDRVHHFLDQVIAEHKFQFDLGDEVDGVLATAIKLGVAFLTAVAAHLDDRHAFNTNLMQGGFDRFQLGVLNDRFDFCHRVFAVYLVSGELTYAKSQLCRDLPIVPLLAVLRQIQTLNLVVFGDAQAHHDINNLENDERSDDGQHPGNRHADRLIE